MPNPELFIYSRECICQNTQINYVTRRRPSDEAGHASKRTERKYPDCLLQWQQLLLSLSTAEHLTQEEPGGGGVRNPCCGEWSLQASQQRPPGRQENQKSDNQDTTVIHTCVPLCLNKGICKTIHEPHKL